MGTFSELLLRRIARQGLSHEGLCDDFAARTGVPADRGALLRVLRGDDEDVQRWDSERHGALAQAAGVPLEELSRLLVAPLFVVWSNDSLSPGCLRYLKQQAVRDDAGFVLRFCSDRDEEQRFLELPRAHLVLPRRGWMRDEEQALLLQPVQDPPRSWTVEGFPDLFGPPYFDVAPERDERGFPYFVDPQREVRERSLRHDEECAVYGNALFTVTDGVNVSQFMSSKDQDGAALGRRIAGGQATLWAHNGEAWLYEERDSSVAAERAKRFETLFLSACDEAFARRSPLDREEQWNDVVSRIDRECGVTLPNLVEWDQRQRERADNRTGWPPEHSHDRTSQLHDQLRRVARKPVFDDPAFATLLDGLLSADGCVPQRCCCCGVCETQSQSRSDTPLPMTSSRLGGRTRRRNLGAPFLALPGIRRSRTDGETLRAGVALHHREGTLYRWGTRPREHQLLKTLKCSCCGLSGILPMGEARSGGGGR